MGLTLPPEPVLAVVHETALENAATFFQIQYNSDLQLLAEAPSVPIVYWLWVDNYVGYPALRFYNTTMAAAIYVKLEECGYMQNYAYEALFSKMVELPFKAPNQYNVEEGADYTIKLDIYNGSRMED